MHDASHRFTLVTENESDITDHELHQNSFDLLVVHSLGIKKLDVWFLLLYSYVVDFVHDKYCIESKTEPCVQRRRTYNSITVE